MNHSYTFNVAPRYSAGSPASVDERTARRVIIDERSSYLSAITGLFGAVEQDRASKPYALNGIVERRLEYADGWVVYDMMTLDVFYRFNRDDRLPTLRQRERARERIRMELREVLLEQVSIIDRIVKGMANDLLRDNLVGAMNAAEELEILAVRIAEQRPDRLDDYADPMALRTFAAVAAIFPHLDRRRDRVERIGG